MKKNEKSTKMNYKWRKWTKKVSRKWEKITLKCIKINWRFGKNLSKMDEKCRELSKVIAKKKCRKMSENKPKLCEKFVRIIQICEKND